MSSYPQDWSNRTKATRSRDQDQCAICGRSDVELHVHHVTPLSMGGSNSLDNLITLCRECHESIHRDNEKPGEAAPKDSCYFCTNCNRYYSIEYGRKHGEKCPVCELRLRPWIGENRV